MSQNADTIRQGFEAFNAFMRDELSSEAYAEGFDPQIELLWRDRQRTLTSHSIFGGSQSSSRSLSNIGMGGSTWSRSRLS